MKTTLKGLKISFNAPAVLGFSAICVAALALNLLTGGAANRAVFSVYRASLLDPLTYLRCVAHVFGHTGWQHLINNLMYILILGPMLEEKYGTPAIIRIMLIAAAVTGVIHMLLFPGVRLLGASGIVFAMILLAPITATEDNAIPFTFLLVAALYLGQQVYEGLFTHDRISQMAHIAGGLVGAAAGFVLNRRCQTRAKKF